MPRWMAWLTNSRPCCTCRGAWTSTGGSSSYGIRMRPVWAASPGSTQLPGRRSSCRSTARPSFAQQCCRAAGMKRCGCGSPRCMCPVAALTSSRLGEGRSSMATSVCGPLTSYQTIFAAEPGSAEMPSAGRPFTTDLVTRIFIGGVDLATVLLHSGVSSLEAHEPPDAEPFQVSAQAAQRVNAVHRLGGRVIAVGTTVVRALESAAVARGLVLPAAGLTDLVIDAAYSPRMVTGVLTGWHQPRASHLGILEAVAGRDLLRRSYREALGAGYLWHEFGDSHLILP